MLRAIVCGVVVFAFAVNCEAGCFRGKCKRVRAKASCSSKCVAAGACSAGACSAPVQKQANCANGACSAPVRGCVNCR